MSIPPGQNLRDFSPLVESQNIVKKVTASSNEYSSKIAFNVPAQHKAVVGAALREIGVLTHEWNTESYGTWFDVVGLVNIKKSLDHLLGKNLIANEFYQTLVERFPKAYGGNLNLSNRQIEVLDLFGRTTDILDSPSNLFGRTADLFGGTTDILVDLFGTVSILSTSRLPGLSPARTSFRTQLPSSSEPIRIPEAINATQKNIIDGTLKDIFDCIQSRTPSEISLRAMELINKDELSTQDCTFLEKHDLFSEVDFVRKILQHPHPQNRSIGDSTTGMGSEGIRAGRAYFWRNGFGTGVISEPQGLLGLSARNDSTAPPVTREATVNYIKTLLKRETLQLVEKDKKEKQQLEVRAKLAQQQAERLAFYNLKAQILGTNDRIEAELVRTAFRKA